MVTVRHVPVAQLTKAIHEGDNSHTITGTANKLLALDASGNLGEVTLNPGLSLNDLTLTVSNSSLVRAIKTVTADYTVTTSDHTILVNAASGPVTIATPAASTIKDYIFNIKKIDATANAVTVNPNASETVDGATTLALSSQWAKTTIHCNGASFFTI